MPTLETIYDPSRSTPPPDVDLMEVEKEERRFLLRVFAWMVPALLLSAIATDVALAIFEHASALQGPLWLGWVAFALLMLAANWISNKIEKMPGYVAVAALLGFAFLNGAIFDLLFRGLTGHSFLPVYLSSAALFLFIFVYGSQTEGELTSFPNLAIYACVGILVSMTVNRFMGSPVAVQLGSAVVIMAFLGLIIANLQFLRDLKFEFDDAPPERKAAAVGALLLYLDVVLIFLTVLQIPGRLLGTAAELTEERQRRSRNLLNR
jgi:FtsH-binding integral membrane protein